MMRMNIEDAARLREAMEDQTHRMTVDAADGTGAHEAMMQICTASMAISLRRIADRLDKDAERSERYFDKWRSFANDFFKLMQAKR